MPAIFDYCNGELPERVRDPIVMHLAIEAQYCLHDYRDLAKQLGMTMSMSGKGDCYDSVPMESFWSLLKKEFVYGVSRLNPILSASSTF